jgi:AmpD protein
MIKWLNGVNLSPSPHRSKRNAKEVHLIVLHHISLPPCTYGRSSFIENFFCGIPPCPPVHPYIKSIEHLKVSAHFLIKRTGEITQFVPITETAWHAGVSCWEQHPYCNDYSLGIELEGCDWHAFTPFQYSSLRKLLIQLKTLFPKAQVTTHKAIAPDRKSDPGCLFDKNVLDL